MVILSGLTASEHYYKIIEQKIYEYDIKPALSIVMVGNNEASQVYVSNKIKKAKNLGYQANLISLPEKTSVEELFDVITDLNNNTQVNGYIIQLPLPPHLQVHKEAILNKINPIKDVDGLSPYNIGKLILQSGGFIPATPLGIILLMKFYNISPASKKIVIIGRSQIVGMPLAILLASNHSMGNATVTICHSKTKNLQEIAQTADILISATGSPHLINHHFVKEKAVIIDVGISRINGKICGDVNAETIKEKAYAFSPVPGGVGPMTICALLFNTFVAALLQNGKISQKELPYCYYELFL